MLKSLHIRNLAIIDELDLEFAGGFTVLTGETGAGKSILIDALGLVTGSRADAALVRAGRDKAEITAEFDLADSPAAGRWLEEHELMDADAAGSCLMRRVLYAEGRNRAFVNNAPVSVAALRELGERLLEVFGQNESQTLLRPEAQRAILDEFGGYVAERTAVSEAAARWRECQAEIDRLSASGPSDPGKLDYLQFQLRELEAVNLQEGELETLELDHKRLANAGRLLQQGGETLELLYGGETSAYDQLAGAGHVLAELSDVDGEFAAVNDLLSGAQAQLHEAAQTLKRLLDRLDLDPDELQRVDRRLTDLHELARKHRIRTGELPERLRALQREVAEHERGSERLAELELARDAALKTYRSAAERLSAQRRKAAKSFAAQATLRIQRLGMPNAQFLVAVEAAFAAAPRPAGDDEVRFDFSANPGQPPRALAKVASGGELSRVSLAVQVVALHGSAAATMIFDEVDAGIGGAVAEIVGAELRGLGAGRQVLCVTHLAQVAAQGDTHLAIRKEVIKGETYTRIDAMGATRRVQELARMLGGVEITASTSAHASELLARVAKTG